MTILEIIFYLLVILLTTILGVFIFLNKKTKDGRFFSYSIGFATAWITLVFLFFYVNTEEYILWIGRSAFAVVLLLLLSLVFFIRSFPVSVKITKKSVFYRIVEVITVIFFLITLLTPFVIEYEIITGIAQRDTVYGPLYFSWVAYFIFLFGLIIYNAGVQYKKTKKGVERSQILYTFVGTCLAIIIGFLTTVVLVAFDFVGAERFGPPLGLLIFFSFTSYAILRHRLMDIKVATGKVVTYFFSFLSVGCVGYGIMFFKRHFGISEEYASVIIAITVAAIFQPIFTFFERLASQYLYYSFYSSQNVLNDLGEKLIGILNIDELADLITKTIMSTMKLERAVILLRDEKTGKFYIKRNFGFKEENGISLVSDNFLTEHLQKTKKPLVYEELSLMLECAEIEQERKNIHNLKQNMERIEAALSNLLIFKNQVVGMIVLGEKKSRAPYTEQDVKLIDNLCKQISVSVENAKLYSEVQDLSQNLEKKVDEQVKELRVAYKKLQRIDKAKTEFMSIVSHQLRTPLSIIKGHLSMIREGVYDDDKKKKEKVLKNIYEANDRLIVLVNDVLNISRIQSGRVEINKEKVSMEKVISDTVEKMEKSAKDKEIDLIFHKPEKEISQIEADVNKTENVLLNIIDNAIKYTNKGSVEVYLEEEESDVLIKIKDTGEGMKKEEIEKLFATFSRGDAGKKHWIQGSGLGLYIARQFVEIQGGKIWAESEGEGKGSEFYIKLPKKAA